jgi:hypothetical protein
VVRSQIAKLTPNPSYGHNLCFKCPNGSWEPILDIWVSKAFQSYKEILYLLSFDPWNCSLKIWKSIGTPIPKVATPFGSVRVHSLTLSYTPGSMWCDSWAPLLARNLGSLCFITPQYPWCNFQKLKLLHMAMSVGFIMKDANYLWDV